MSVLISEDFHKVSQAFKKNEEFPRLQKTTLYTTCHSELERVYFDLLGEPEIVLERTLRAFLRDNGMIGGKERRDYAAHPIFEGLYPFAGNGAADITVNFPSFIEKEQKEFAGFCMEVKRISKKLQDVQVKVLSSSDDPHYVKCYVDNIKDGVNFIQSYNNGTLDISRIQKLQYIREGSPYELLT